MKIHFLGTRANIEASAPYHSKHSGILIDEKLLFDLGEKEFLRYKPVAVILTHLHPDHAYFVASEKEEIPELPVYGPAKDKQVISLDKPENISGFNVSPVPTIHSKYVDSQAYIIEKGNIRILYTGDMVWIKKEHHHKLKKLDLVITDGSYLRKGGMIRRDDQGNIYGHQGIPGLVNLFRQFTDHIIFTHFGSWFYKDMKEARKKLNSFGIKTDAAYDGMKVSLHGRDKP